MVMNDRLDVGTRLIDLAVDETFEVETAALGVDGDTIEIEFDDVVGRHEFRSERARQEVARQVIGMPCAHVAVTRQDALRGEDAIGGDEIFDHRGDSRRSLLRLKARRETMPTTRSQP